jgi:hypothetical protein
MEQWLLRRLPSVLLFLPLAGLHGFRRIHGPSSTCSLMIFPDLSIKKVTRGGFYRNAWMSSF